MRLIIILSVFVFLSCDHISSFQMAKKTPVPPNKKVDSINPQIQFLVFPDKTTFDSNAYFSFEVKDSVNGIENFECRLDGPVNNHSFENCKSPIEYHELSEGVYQFHVRVYKQDGDPAIISYEWEILTEADLKIVNEIHFDPLKSGEVGNRWLEVSNEGAHLASDIRYQLEFGKFNIVQDSESFELCGESLPLGKRCWISIEFQSFEEGFFKDELIIEYYNGKEFISHSVKIFAHVLEPAVLSTGYLKYLFEPTTLKTFKDKQFALTNFGETSGKILSIEIKGGSAFELIHHSSCKGVIEAQNHCSLTIRFRPYHLGYHQAHLVVRYQDGKGISTSELELIGRGQKGVW